MGIKYWGVEEIHLSLFCQTCTLSQRPKRALEKVSHVNFYFLFKKCENNFSPFLDKFSCVKNCGSNAMLSISFLTNLPISQFAYFTICLFHQNLPISPEFAYNTRICLLHQNLHISPEFAYFTRICLYHQNLPISPEFAYFTRPELWPRDNKEACAGSRHSAIFKLDPWTSGVVKRLLGYQLKFILTYALIRKSWI